MRTEHRFEDEWLLKAVEALALPVEAVTRLRDAGEPALAEALLGQGIVDWPRWAAAVGAAFSLPAVDLTADLVEKSALALLPQAACERLRALPLRLAQDTLRVAMARPRDAEAIRELELLAGRRIEPVYARPQRIALLLGQCYSDDMKLWDALEKLGTTDKVEVLDATGAPSSVLEASSPVERLVNALIAHAARTGAEEIRVDHGAASSEIRILLDGRLRPLLSLPARIADGPLAARVKALAGLDAGERTRGQEGRAVARVEGREFGLRIFSRGTPAGERLALRVLDDRAGRRTLEQLGFRANRTVSIDALTDRRGGLFLVAGPPGSGKTVALYGLLNAWTARGLRGATVEDPVEFRRGDLTQLSVDRRSGFDFSTAFRSALRSGPDVLLLGEMRDAATAAVALDAAARGKRVVAGVPTADAVSAFARLIDWGLSADRIAAHATGALGLRLLRRLCPACRRPDPDAKRLPALASALEARGLAIEAFRPGGCVDCGFTGYRGRSPLSELLTPTEPFLERLKAGDDDAGLRRAAETGNALAGWPADALDRLSAGDVALQDAAPYLDLPAAPTSETPPETPPAVSAPAPSAKEERRVLVTDDDAVVRTVLRKTLESEGWTVEEAADGIQALARTADRAPDLLLLDLDMPEMDGFGVLKLLRRRMGLVNLPVIVLTSSEDDNHQKQALDLGADDYLLKPVQPDAIRARVRALLRRREIG